MKVPVYGAKFPQVPLYCDVFACSQIWRFINAPTNTRIPLRRTASTSPTRRPMLTIYHIYLKENPLYAALKAATKSITLGAGTADLWPFLPFSFC